MEIIYRAFDGKEFNNEADCCYHEYTIKEGVKMWDRDGKEVSNTPSGFVVYLRDVEANLAFYRIAEACEDKDISGIAKGEDYGLFLWDEYEGRYRWIDEEEIMVLAKAIAYLDSQEV